MSDVIAFLDRQNGKSNRKTYDTALTRLCVHKNDCWRGIVPSVDVADYNPEPPIFAAKFANMPSNKHILALANEDGKIALQNCNIKNDDTMEKSLDGKQCHNNAVFDLEWMPGNMKFVSASGDHTARLWSVQESCFKLLQVFNGHTRSVKTAAWRTRDPAIFATGGRDGAIMIWDTRVALHVNAVIKADNCIFSGHMGCSATPPSVRRRSRMVEKNNFYTVSNSITGLVFNDDFTLISCGAGDGIIKVWDLRRNYTTYKKEPTPKHCFNYPGTTTFKGYTNLIIDNLSHRLYVNCMDNNIYCYNISKYGAHPIMKYSGFRNSTFYIKSCLSPDGRYIVSGSSDEKAYIWNVNNTDPLVALGGQAYEVTCVAWSDTNDMNIVTCSDDARHKIWRTSRQFDNDDEENLKLNYRCMAERCNEYKAEQTAVTQIIKNTPKSVKRTISCITYNSGDGNNSMKRLHLDNTNEKLNGTIDSSSKSKGRRLFSPSPSTSNYKHNTLTTNTTIDDNYHDHDDQLANLAAILEETDTVIDDKNNLNNRINNHIIINNHNNNSSSSISIDNINKNNINKFMSPTKTKLLSPLAERYNCNLMSSPIPTAATLPSSIADTTDGNCDTTAIPNTPNTILTLTANLPNFVIDGEAPHIIQNQISPKRKLKENVDWLTKIRKQKLKSISNQLSNDKLTNPPITNNNDNNVNNNSDNFNDNECNSKFKEPENVILTHHTPTAKKPRHHTNTTLLRFFNVIHRKPVISNQDIK